MAAEIKVGTFTGRATNGDVSVTGVGFTPLVVLITSATTTNFDTFTDAIYVQLGISTGTTAATQWTQNIGAKWDGVATFNLVTRRGLRTDEVLSDITADFGFANMLGDLKSFDVDGFTVTFAALAGSANDYNYLAIGGSGVSVKIGTATWPTATGNQAVTGVGFEPDLLLLSAGGEFIGAETATTPGLAWSLGWVDESGNQAVSCFHEAAGSPNGAHRYQRGDKCVAILDSTTGAVAGEAEFVSFDADGFTVNWTDAHSAASSFTYLAMAGVRSYAGTLTQPSATGDQLISGVPISPLAVLFQSVGAAASASVATGTRYSLGFGSPSYNGGTWAGDNDGTNFAGRRTVGKLSNTASIIHASPSGTAAGTVEAEAAVSAVGDGSFTLDWASADATGREVAYLALGDEPVTVTGSAVFGVNTTVSVTRAIACGLDGSTNVHSDIGKFKVFGKIHATETIQVEDVSGTTATSLIGIGPSSALESVAVGSGLSMAGNTLSASGGNSFGTVQVSGQSDVVADASSDTLTLVAGTDVVITTNAATDTITIGVAAGASGNNTESTAFGSETLTDAGDLNLYTNGFYLSRYSGSAWVPWGPLFPMTAPVNGDFSWVNQGSASVVTTNGGIVLTGELDNALNIRARVKTAPTAPYTVTVAMLPRVVNATQQLTGVCWREASSGKLGIFGVDCQAAGATALSLNLLTDETTYSSTPFTISFHPVLSILWLKLEDDNTNRKLSWSADGVNFMEIYSVGRTSFLTPDQVGFYVGDTTNTYVPAVTVLSWKEA